jgi:hypothetical protein
MFPLSWSDSLIVEGIGLETLLVVLTQRLRREDPSSLDLQASRLTFYGSFFHVGSNLRLLGTISSGEMAVTSRAGGIELRYRLIVHIRRRLRNAARRRDAPLGCIQPSRS